MDDLRDARIGAGSVGGKARGLACAREMLEGSELAGTVRVPELTITITTELFDGFISSSGLDHLYDERDGERALAAVLSAPLPSSARRDLERALERFDAIGSPPIAVRSSSLLEDSAELAFAGKYHTFFFANRGSIIDRASELELLVRRVYASTFCDSARAYREKHGRSHRDESMAVMLQSIHGRDREGLFYPELAGAIFTRVSRSPSPRIKKEEGLMRLCFGLGTRCVERGAARTFFLSAPSLRPEGGTPAQIASSSQDRFDFIDLRGASSHGAPSTALLRDHLPQLRRAHKNISSYVERFGDGYLYSSWSEPEIPTVPVFSFPELHLRERGLFANARRLCELAERTCGMPMDMEIAYEPLPEPDLRLVQMRPLATFRGESRVELPDVPEERVIFRGSRMIVNGRVERAEHLVFVDARTYRDEWRPGEAARAVGEVNERLAGTGYILAGPGRWGSSDPTQGVPVLYSEICGASCLVEYSAPELGFSPELSFGTHFFVDMDSDGMLYLPVFCGEAGSALNAAALESLPYETASHPSVRVYTGSFSAFLDGENERGIVLIDT